MVTQDLSPQSEQIYRRFSLGQQCVSMEQNAGFRSGEHIGPLPQQMGIRLQDPTFQQSSFESPLQRTFHARDCSLFFKSDRGTLQFKRSHTCSLINVFFFWEKVACDFFYLKDPLEERHRGWECLLPLSPLNIRVLQYPPTNKQKNPHNLTFVRARLAGLQHFSFTVIHIPVCFPRYQKLLRAKFWRTL